MKIALVTDSTSDLRKEIIEKYNIEVLPFRIIYKDREYLDGIEITPQEVYERLPIEIPTTSVPSQHDIHQLYRRLIREGYTHVIVITLSSGLSGISNAIRVVSEQYEEEIISHIYDSKSISCGEGVFVELCGEMIQQGRSFDEIVKALPELKKKTKLFFVVGTLDYLKKGGRIGKVMGTISEILQIKPIISTGDDDGKYYTFDKVRGRKQSLHRIFEIGKEILEKKRCKIYVMSGAAREEAEEIVQRFKELKNTVSVSYGGDISPVAGVHSGPGLVGVLFVDA